MADFYEVSQDLVRAASSQSLDAPEGEAESQRVQSWIENQSVEALKELACRLLLDEEQTVRAETLARIRDDAGGAVWPTAPGSRSFAELLEAATAEQARRLRREEQASQRARKKRLKQIAAQPQKTIARAKRLVNERSTRSYEEAARLLTDLREALGPDHGPRQARQIAQQLIDSHPTSNVLKSVLRRHGLLPKR